MPVAANDIAIYNGELLVLSDSGIHSRHGDGWTTSPGVAGGQALAVDEVGVLICGPDGVRRYGIEEEQLTELACLDIAAVPGGFWILNEQGVFNVPGDGPVALEAVRALGGGKEHAWVSANRLHLGEERRLIFPGATDVARLETSEGVEWVLVHPERSLLGLIGASGLESAWPQSMKAHAVAVGDLGLDGDLDIVLAGPDGWMSLEDGRKVALPQSNPAIPAPIPLPRYTPPPPRPRPETVRLLGIKMPKFAGLQPEPEYDSMFVGGFGLAVGKPLGSNQLALGFSPGAVGGVERGTGRFRTYFGADSAPLYSWSGNFVGIHLVMATAGFTIGSDRLRAGPFASLGLLGAGAGVRGVFTPFASRTGKLTGFEGRLTWFYPNAGHAALYYVSSFPMGRRGRPAAERKPRRSFCRRFSMGLGVAAGFSSTENAWEFVGREAKFQYSYSPALTISCESGSKTAGWSIGGETAPFFFYRVPTIDGGADRRLNHMGSATVGLFVGGNRFRAGPILTAGIWTLGAGFRAGLTPFRTPGGVYHGLELRAVALWPSSPAGQAMAIYTLAFDPKSKRSKAQ